MNTDGQKKGMAITGLVLGILSLLCLGVFSGIPAIILGHIAYNRARKMPEQFGGAGLAIASFVMGYCSIFVTIVALGLAAAFLPALAHAKERAQYIQCVNNMKQIGLAFRIWSSDDAGRFPFNVSVQEGGSMELCRPGVDGFDRNPAAHFQVLSNELNTPKILVCPADHSKSPAADFSRLQAANVSYLLRSGTNVSEVFPGEVLARCPIHGHVLLCDGSVQGGRRK